MLWIGIALMPIRIRISMLIPIQIRIHIGTESMPILIRILSAYPKFLYMLENHNFLKLFVTACQFTMFNLSHQCQRCHIFQFFAQVHTILKFCGNSTVYQLFLLFRLLIPIRIGRIRFGMPWVPIPIRPIRIGIKSRNKRKS